ncbi:hypothetical protein CC1G_13400 [Coprinopsis cinerea okayama7|uniref:Uncharacterized protein n=1 Tax=Coprinopsis cinerea (strain Okayama-7 / 130 / ATCC MYA-4618 / FGSC 9003) TaxID=240176 RepID=A8NM62_COPC7|nr:hypothetical protein CC1G_13400 [Coprinopsis cinerea okayama7\|eukprot:XP_001834853.1 hypothetical protein CC1G_13400 [Coprinopsis cinerea okayama7\
MAAQRQAVQLKEEGNALFKAKQYEASIAKFTDAIQLDNRNPVFYGNRAASFFFLRRFHEVLSDCRAALNLDSRYTKAWLRKGDAHDALTQYADSIESYSQALSLTPSYESEHDDLKRRIEHVKSKILHPSSVGLDTLSTIARLHSIQIPNLQAVQTPSQIDELRRALFRHPKWSFPSASSHKPHPARIRFLLVPSDDRIPVAPRSNIELGTEEEPAKNYDREIRRLLGGCARYTREIILSEDWESYSPQRPFGVGLGRFHSIYEIYYGLPTSDSPLPSLNRRACSLLSRNDIYGPALIVKGVYVKTDRRLLDLTFASSQSASARPKIQVSPCTLGNALLGMTMWR